MERIVVIPDTQFPYELTGLVQAVINFIGDYQPDQLVQIGDLMDYPQPSSWSKDTAAEFRGSVLADNHYAKKTFLRPLRKVYDGPFKVFEGNHDCVSTRTRAVTKDGYKHIDQLTKNDKVLSVNDDGETFWQGIDEIVRYDYTGPLVSYRGEGFNMEVTPNHRVVGLNKTSGDWVEHRADELPHKMKVYTSGYNRQAGIALAPFVIRLAAWGLTDSHRSRWGQWTLYQSGDKAQRVRDLLNEAGVTFNETARDRDTTQIMGTDLKSIQTSYEFRVTGWLGGNNILDGYVPDRDELPEWVWQLSESQANMFIDELVFTDGTHASNGNSRVIYCGRTKLREDIMRLCSMNGIRATSTEYRPGQWRINLLGSGSQTSGLYRQDVEEIDYDGEVWCLRVPNERFFVELDGKVHLTGNSRPRQYLTKYAPALSDFDVFRFEKMLEFDSFGIERAPDFWDFAPGWVMTHGHLGGIRLSQTAGGSAIGAAKKFLKSVVMGHTHRMAVLPVTLGYGDTETTLFGVEVGHMMDPRKAQYLKGAAANWQAGFVILNVDREAGIVIPEPIFVHGDTFKVDGEVYKIKEHYEFQ